MHLGVCRHIPRARKNRRNPKNPLGQSHMSRLGPTPAAMSVEYSCLRGYFSTTGPISTWFSPRIQIPSRFVEVSHHYSRISIPCRLLRTWTGMCAVCSGMCTRHAQESRWAPEWLATKAAGTDATPPKMKKASCTSPAFRHDAVSGLRPGSLPSLAVRTRKEWDAVLSQFGPHHHRLIKLQLAMKLAC